VMDIKFVGEGRAGTSSSNFCNKSEYRAGIPALALWLIAIDES